MTTPGPNDQTVAIGSLDLHLFNEGRHRRLYDALGAHAVGEEGIRFAVFAPNAASVSVAHDGNGWDDAADQLEPLGSSGVWAGFSETARVGHRYKYVIDPHGGRPRRLKADPLAFATEVPPQEASVITDLTYSWSDDDWMSVRRDGAIGTESFAAYEVHLGSWQRGPDGTFLRYEEIGKRLADHVSALGFTHVELLPVMEHPYYGSWGYQVTGYFAPTARYGAPTGLMELIDTLHQAGIGVILDWVPSHFATDSFALGEFDGTHVYEHEHPLKRSHPDWGSYEFNYGRHEVRSFLISSACFWLDRYHADGLRFDGVASMLYLDYSRGPGQWIPNEYGGREDLEAIHFIRECNHAVHESFPGALVIAEESTAWPGVTRPVQLGGLGFDMKWDMGWMHDTLGHLARDPIYRRHHYNELTFRGLYAFSECFVLPLSHDEVVHGKGSLLGKMPGDEWQKLANLRLLYSYQYLQPGKKMLFMGAEIGTWREWNHEAALDWGLLASPRHAGIAAVVHDLNVLYRERPEVHAHDFDPSGFTWVVADDPVNDVLAWFRHGPEGSALAVANMTPVVRENYRIGVPPARAAADADAEDQAERTPPVYEVVFNSDDLRYGGSGAGSEGVVHAEHAAAHGQEMSLSLTLPPLAMMVLVPYALPETTDSPTARPT
jgi:1,4-alpha-glucan branching enzyme